ncbi:transglycosylase domain-containing protein [Budviciaceae bacterium CWB-B4]|uniref:Transglycosylase domain-containing protein n=1 Tax=Limnobaculum xujianqingii TaxID=2738837 RepID=A0A9D7FRL4_9GAMM|nr:transglycosylase domain-containing protein [Limnobaculum xujianqingii]MBK5072284.1 transglycosylase domain-containing protein [Limnobaculum xujianqingii]MBK5175593.1 transglycosylase domain-containing protein [Limnobaculum xujianqingii]
MIKKILRRLFCTIALLFSGIIFALCGYYLVEIEPHRSEITSLSQSLNQAPHHNPQIDPLLSVIYPTQSIYASASRDLFFHFHQGQRISQGKYHLHHALWQLWLTVLYNQSEINSIWLAEAYFGSDNGNPVYGLEHASQVRFSAPVSTLNCSQLVELLAMLHAPSLYKAKPELFKQRVEKLEVKGCSEQKVKQE